MPSGGIHTRPGSIPSGSRMRLCNGSESTAATQPSASTANAGLPDARQDRRCHGAQPVQDAVVLLTQVRFGQPGDGVDEGDGGRMHGRRGPGHVDDTDDLPGARIPDRRTRAGPGVVAAHEMFGREHLNGAVRHQRGADAVGADSALAPVRAFDEPEPVGIAQHRR